MIYSAGKRDLMYRTRYFIIIKKKKRQEVFIPGTKKGEYEIHVAYIKTRILRKLSMLENFYISSKKGYECK